MNQLLEKLEELRSALSSHGGEQVLVKHQYVDRMREDYDLYLGILQEPFAEYVRRSPMKKYLHNDDFLSLHIVTDGHVKKESYKPGFSTGKNWEAEKGPIKMDMDALNYLGKDFDWERSHCYSGWPKPVSAIRSFNVIAGDKNVGSEFWSGKSIGRMREKPDLSYVNALNLLGLQAPKRFQGLYNMELKKDRLNVIRELLSLYNIGPGIESEISRIYNSIPSGVMASNGALMLVEDGDDASVMSIGYREKIKETDAKISSNLEKAVALGLDKSDMVLKIGPGITLKAGEFVKNLRKKYSVKKL